MELTPDLLSDDALYRRTPAGQRELIDPRRRLSTQEKRFLSAVTGYTPLRVLLDLGLDAPGIHQVVRDLVAHGLMMKVHPT